VAWKAKYIANMAALCKLSRVDAIYNMHMPNAIHWLIINAAGSMHGTVHKKIVITMKRG